VTIELTPAQARAVAELVEREGGVALRRPQPEEATEGAGDEDVYATPIGGSAGYRIDGAGRVTELGQTLPAGH
jgi:hypothetical protein